MLGNAREDKEEESGLEGGSGGRELGFLHINSTISSRESEYRTHNRKHKARNMKHGTWNIEYTLPFQIIGFLIEQMFPDHILDEDQHTDHALLSLRYSLSTSN